MSSMELDIEVPHRININGEMVEIAEISCKVVIGFTRDDWFIESASVDCIGEDNKRRQQDVPKQSPLWQSIRDYIAKHPHDIECEWADWLWEHPSRHPRTDLEEHGTLGR